ncbi:SpoIIE family protein phosphatase [Streptomyces liangshanensis]|uniref:protein-serine/threonine phosphatase n=1 Tax=Streptomyces liangshanensis TaxID=2717324 RepID=A0A6G9H6S2_9ACTN|nr:SpoIIE family protein phosphatase [Streptomyces liangshanensis]QIQ06190.1 SpoIIE family protein phosphatase [Streptomyces liangshanensis]
MERRSARSAPDRDATLQALGADLRAALPRTLAANRMGGFLRDLRSDLIFLDEGALAVFDLPPDGFDGRPETLYARMVPEDVAGFREMVSRARSEPGDYGTYFRILGADGTIRWAHTQGVVERDAEGNPLRAIGIVRDASAELRHVAQQAVLEPQRRHQNDVVTATTAALSRALTVEDVLDALTSREILGPVGAQAISLTVLDQDRLRRIAVASLPMTMREEMEFSRIDADLPVAEAFRSHRPVFITRASVEAEWPQLWPHVKDTPLTAGAILPLIAQARPTGVLSIMYEGKTAFTPEEQNLLLALAATIAQSVQRAALYDEEHAMAVGLQQSMLPATIPDMPGVRVAVRYQPARTGHQIGGDWYDVVPLRGGRVGLVVGDVQGHDIQASAVMGQLRTALRAYAAEGHAPAAVMARASRFLQDLDTDRLATCIYVDLDPATGRARLVRAGHPGPVIRHADGSSSSPDVAGGLPFGLLQYSDAPYPTTELVLGPDETLLLCTDGLLEFRGEDIDVGERRIRSALYDGPGDLDRLAEYIVDTIETRQGQEDDVALLLATLAPGRDTAA